MAECIIIPLDIELYYTPRDPHSNPIKGERSENPHLFSLQNYVGAQLDPIESTTVHSLSVLHIHTHSCLIECIKVHLERQINCADCAVMGGTYYEDMGLVCAGTMIPPGVYRINVDEQPLLSAVCDFPEQTVSLELIIEPVTSAYYQAMTYNRSH